MIETEIRAVFEDTIEIKKRLLDLGFRRVKILDQIDTMLDKPDASLFKSGQKIRIREQDGKAELTYKGKFIGEDGLSKRSEVNVSIGQDDVNSMISLFERIGFPFCFRIPKRREVFVKENIEVSIDSYPIIGKVVEIEGEENQIKEVASLIAPNTNFANPRLKEIFLDTQKKLGKSLSELQKEYEEKNNIKLGNLSLVWS